MLTITIDWLAINFKELNHASKKFMSLYARAGALQDTTPRFGYSHARVDSNGVVVQWNPDREDMGYHVIFAGSALRNLFEHEIVQPIALLHACINAGGRVARLDLAKDLTGQEIDLQTIYQSLEQGAYSGTSRTYGRIESNNGGETIYVGSRQSEKFIRIYNKAAQIGDADRYWFRFEIETKGMVARALATTLVNTRDFSGVFDTTVKAMVDIPTCPAYNEFFALNQTPIGLPKLEKQTDRERWIDTQVIAAVSKHFIEHPDSEAVKRLIDTLNYLRSTLH